MQGKAILYRNNGILDIVGHSYFDWNVSVDNRCSTSGYCVFACRHLVTLENIAHSSTEVEYRAIENATWEVIWVKKLMEELGCLTQAPVRLHL